MSQQTCQHRFVSGRRRLLVITVALGIGNAVAVGLVLDSQAAAARECARETPLPAEVHLIAPVAEVPEAVARFAGAWIGAWLNKGNEALCHTLVVEEVMANGYARVIFSYGTYSDWDIHLPQFLRATGRIVDGALRFHLPVPERPRLAYRFVGEVLQGTYNDEGRVRLTRVADVSQVGCGAQAGGLLPAPPVSGPRDRLTADELLAPAYTGDGPVPNAYFLPVGQVAPALHTFTGTLTIEASPMSTAKQWVCRPGKDPAWLHGRLLHPWGASGARRTRYPAAVRHHPLPGPGMVGAWR